MPSVNKPIRMAKKAHHPEREQQRGRRNETGIGIGHGDEGALSDK
jgi:hypothetical protein